MDLHICSKFSVVITCNLCIIATSYVLVLLRPVGAGGAMAPPDFGRSVDIESFWTEGYAGQTPNSGRELAIYVHTECIFHDFFLCLAFFIDLLTYPY